MYGEPLLVEGTELLARALQHETDHLNGVLFIDRLPAELRKEAMKEINPADYKETLHLILVQQLEKCPDVPPFERKSKAFRYALSRGFESPLIEEFFGRE